MVVINLQLPTTAYSRTVDTILQFSCFLVTANGCYDPTVMCSIVLAHVCFQFDVYPLPGVSKWCYRFAASGVMHWQTAAINLQLVCVVVLSKMCYQLTAIRSKGCTNGCYICVVEKIPFRGKWMLSTCWYPQQWIRKLLLFNWQCIRHHFAGNGCYQFTIFSNSVLSKIAVELHSLTNLSRQMGAFRRQMSAAMYSQQFTINLQLIRYTTLAKGCYQSQLFTAMYEQVVAIALQFMS